MAILINRIVFISFSRSFLLPCHHVVDYSFSSCYLKATSSDYSSSPSDHGHHSVRNDTLYHVVALSFIDIVYPRCSLTRHWMARYFWDRTF